MALKTKLAVGLDKDRNSVGAGNGVEDVAALRSPRGFQAFLVFPGHKKSLREIDLVPVVDI
jgi:hypothetical protein